MPEGGHHAGTALSAAMTCHHPANAQSVNVESPSTLAVALVSFASLEPAEFQLAPQSQAISSAASPPKFNLRI
jgi:hypothetical protein